ncbi:MAG TPA: hypothetical protein VGC57_00535 [Cellulomonas sp.]
MYEFAGPAALVVVGLWIAYLVPYKLRHRQQMLESRTDDRFSEALRVLAVTGPLGSGRRRRADVARPVRADCAREDQKYNGLLHQGSGARVIATGTDREGSDVDRPHGTQDRIGADAVRRAATLHAAHAAATARRGAAARRRGGLAGLLLAATVLAWVVVAATTVPLLVAAVPSVLLVTVLGLGRRAVVQGHAAEAEWQRRITQAVEHAARVRVTGPGRVSVGGRAVRPSLDQTQAIAQVAAAGSTTERVWSGGREGDSWTPVPVPAPTYTTKAAAPRREPAPLGEVEGSTATAARVTGTTGATVTAGAERSVTATAAAGAADAGTGTSATAERTATSATAEEQRTVGPAPATSATTTPEASATGEPTGSIDLDAVLARRRAAGE